MIIILVSFTTSLIGTGLILLIEHSNRITWQQTQQLCHWYANKDHYKELAAERWQWFVDRGIDPNKDFDWYKSCIDHNTKSIKEY